MASKQPILAPPPLPVMMKQPILLRNRVMRCAAILDGQGYMAEFVSIVRSLIPAKPLAGKLFLGR